MTSGCDPDLVMRVAQSHPYNMRPAEAAETRELVAALAEGSYEGQHYSTQDEPQKPAPQGSTKPPDNLPEVEYVDPETVAREALRAVEPFVGGWKDSLLARPGETALAILADIGSTPAALCQPEELEEHAQRLCERPLGFVPEFYEFDLVRAAAEIIARRLLR